ncbi:MAG: hypothetical protein WA830_17755 [Candidatus Sulfotelmatobacter sp.]
MAKTEGIRRIALAGKLILLIGITLGVLGYFVPVLIFGLVLLPLGACLDIAGWIVDGFSQPDS